MPSYVDFESTKRFRDFIINKTLTQPNGPQTFTADNYIVARTSDMANVDPGAVDTNRPNDLLQSQKVNTYKPNEYFITENLNTAPRKANLGLYPTFVDGRYHSFVGVLATDNYETESELMRFAAWNIKENPEGPLFARVQQNLYAATVGRVRLIDAFEGNLATATNILTGKEPLVEGNSKITVASTVPGKVIDFTQTVAGIEFPWIEIPGDYLSNPKNPVGGNVRPEAQTEAGRILQDTTGVLGSLIGIQRRPTVTRKPSDLFIEYMGYRQKQTLFDNLSYSKYAPDYTTTARSQNTSKVFNFVDNFAQGVKEFFGVEAPKGTSYIGDDRGNDVKFAMNDFNDRPVRSNYYLTLMFDEAQAVLFQRKKNIGEGGGISGKLTWISSKSRNKLGANNEEFAAQRSQFEESLSTEYDFRSDSILGITQEILETMPSDGGAARSHVANVIDQTSRIFREGDVMISRGSAVKYVNQFTGQESGVEYCRVWTKDRSYMNYSDTMKRQGNVRKFESSVLSSPWNLNIYPNSTGPNDFAGSTNIKDFQAKKYMFSIENLAWKMSNTPGFTYSDLPYCERGPNNGRVMWFPPYDLKMSEQNSARWETNTFLGRPEPIYTYQNTERSGQISFKVIVDHPSILNLMVKNHFKNMSDEEADNYIHAFFAGCEEVDFYDLVRKYTSLTPDEVKAVQNYMNQNKNPEEVKKYKTVFLPRVSDNPTPKDVSQKETIAVPLYFENDKPQIDNDEYKSSKSYRELYNDYTRYYDGGGYVMELSQGLQVLTGSTEWGVNQQNDYRVIFVAEAKTKPSDVVLWDGCNAVINSINVGFNQLKSNYTQLINSITTLKEKLVKNEVSNITIKLLSRTSFVADDNYNLKLSYRRSYSVLMDIIERLSVDGVGSDAKSMIVWSQTSKLKSSDVESTEPKISIPLINLGYKGNGTFDIVYVSNVGEQPLGCGDDGYTNTDCTDANKIVTSDKLKRTAPVTFFCRSTSVVIEYTTQSSDTSITPVPEMETKLVEDTNATKNNISAPPIDEMKKLIMKALSECYYFKMLEEDSPVQFSSLREKLRYFHPAFHSMTPEGLNSRLTFLHQCVRPGDTLPIKGISDESDLNARNTTFGPPPICILRIGDFYHSKIVIRDFNITFDEGLWDLNPEGIGVQPMMANVTLQVNFIGGHGLERPVERLQNALSSNFYANTEMYDPRSTMTEDRKSLYQKEFLDYLNEETGTFKTKDAQDAALSSANKIIEGEYIGKLEGDATAGYSLDYTQLIDGTTSSISGENSATGTNAISGIYKQAENYTKTFIEGYNSIVATYGSNIGSMLLHPTYRTIKDYTVQTGAGTDTIELLGNYSKTMGLPVLVDAFRITMSGMTMTENISTLMGFNKDMPNSVLVRSEEILKPTVLKLLLSEIDNISTFGALDKMELERDKLIVVLDKLNFVTQYGHDGKIEGNEYSGYNFSGYTYDLLYGVYSNVIEFIKDNQSKFTEDLDTSYLYGTRVMTSEQFSHCLSILLRKKRNQIKEIYTKDSIFTSQIQKKIEKRLNDFLASESTVSTATTPKNFRINRYPIKKNSTEVSFGLTDSAVSFTEEKKTNLAKTLRTSEYKTTTVLNYYRGTKI